jgi:hypothetical protein
MNNTGPIKTGGEPRCSQILGVSVSCKSKTNFRALKDNRLVIWLKQSNLFQMQVVCLDQIKKNLKQQVFIT